MGKCGRPAVKFWSPVQNFLALATRKAQFPTLVYVSWHFTSIFFQGPKINSQLPFIKRDLNFIVSSVLPGMGSWPSRVGYLWTCYQLTFYLSVARSCTWSQGCQGGSVVEWFRALDLKSGGPCSNPPPYYYLDLFSLVPSSTPWPRCVNSQLVSLPLVGILNSLCFIYNICLFFYSVPN